jgi:hypothetical protein
MEMEYFCEPGTQKEWFSHWVDYCIQFLETTLRIKKDNSKRKTVPNKRNTSFRIL